LSNLQDIVFRDELSAVVMTCHHVIIQCCNGTSHSSLKKYWLTALCSLIY